VRMRVDLVRFAVRGPAGVTNSNVAVQWVFLEDDIKVGQLPGTAPDVYTVRPDRGYSVRVVTPVFQEVQALHYDPDSIPVTDIADNSTHDSPTEKGFG
jgi:hypothetical protein